MVSDRNFEEVNMLECNNLTKNYFAGPAVSNLSITINQGKTYALLGPNGSGKTTLMKMIAGLVKPNEGTILLDGEPVTHSSKADITYMPTENYFYSYMDINSIGRYYRDFFKDFDIDLYYKLLKDMELETDTKAKNMSSGMLAKLKLATAMARRSQITLLDEPLNGMDIIARDKIISTILHNRADNNALILSTHLIEELEDLVDELIFIKGGCLIECGPAAEIKAKYNNLSLINIYRKIYGEARDYAYLN